MDVSKTPPELTAQFEALTPDAQAVEKKKVFGHPACFINGNMFMGLHGNVMILRLDGERKAKFVEEQGASIFEPMPGRPMKEYVVVPAHLLSDSASLKPWVRAALEYGSSLPPKEKKAAAARSAAGARARKQ